MQRFDAEHANRLVRELNQVLARVDERLRNTGNLKLTGDLDAAGFQLKNVGTPSADANVVTMEALRNAMADIITDETEDETSDNSGGGGTTLVDDPTSEGGDGGGGGGGGEDAIAEFDARFKEVEVDFGTTPTRVKTFTTTDDDAVASSTKIIMTQSAIAATGRSADENEMDRFAFATRWVSTTSFETLATAVDGPVVGLYRFAYVIGG